MFNVLTDAATEGAEVVDKVAEGAEQAAKWYTTFGEKMSQPLVTFIAVGVIALAVVAGALILKSKKKRK